MPDLTETLGRAGVNLGEALAGESDLEAVQAALVRERVIRDVMRDSGEERQHVADMLDAMASVSQEGVEELTDGQPTTLRDALQRYVEGLEGDSDEEVFLVRVAEELATILNYPFPGPSVELEIERPDDETLTVKVGGELIAGANHDDHGWAGMDLLETTARNVHKAVVGRLKTA